jgi:proteasome activator subunit 4
LFRNKKTIEENLLHEEDTIKFVECLKDITLTAIFSKTHFNDAIKTFQYLTFLKADIMLPPLLDKIYDSFEILIEPHRYTSMLACLVSVPRELAIYSKDLMLHNHQHNLIQLFISILPGIDINDLNKFILTNQLLSNVIACIAVCDCSPAINIRNDLTQQEKELCLLTAKFEDFILELLKK